MSTNAASTYKKLKGLDLAQWSTIFWLVKRKATQQQVHYSVLRVDIDSKLEKRFKNYIRQQLQTRDTHLEKYDVLNADTEDVFLTLRSDATDFPAIEEIIQKGFDNERATDYRDLLNSWAYIIHLEQGRERLYACRKINAITQPKQVASRKALWFRNHRLIDIDEQEVFLIDPRFDFFVYHGITFVSNKRGFESAMNFREGMKNLGRNLLTELESLKLLSDVAPIRDFVGSNLHHLRKLASIRKAGYYTQPDYLKRRAGPAFLNSGEGDRTAPSP